MKITEKQLRKYISESIKNVLEEEFNWHRWDKKSDSEKEEEIDKIIRTNNNYRDGKYKVTDGNGKKVPWKRNSERCLWTKHNNPNGSDEEREVYNNLKKMPLKQAVAESVNKAFNKVLNEQTMAMRYAAKHMNGYYVEYAADKIRDIVDTVVKPYEKTDPTITTTFAIGIIRGIKSFLQGIENEFRQNQKKAFEDIKTLGNKYKADYLGAKDQFNNEERNQFLNLYNALFKVYRIIREFNVSQNKQNTGRF